MRAFLCGYLLETIKSLDDVEHGFRFP
jgi:hypothetical protein